MVEVVLFFGLQIVLRRTHPQGIEVEDDFFAGDAAAIVSQEAI